jgi:hypothetical protein
LLLPDSDFALGRGAARKQMSTATGCAKRPFSRWISKKCNFEKYDFRPSQWIANRSIASDELSNIKKRK